ncbi:MAG TPA: phosphatidate cytidylyltransferase [Bacteroidales bacterium]|nr:phosphatidate cytidylyltransferase [Bacteroidales bacterium]HPR57350.1 phosphatidate cytidylyltransferase [Bacteroidales bacterium]HRW97624.1 phosphatidate cytidylyltransferase [Bacteroidales bacterium]
MNNFFQRSLTAVIFGIAVLGSVFLGPYAFFMLFFLINALAIREFYLMLQKGMALKLNISFGVLLSSLLYLIISLCNLQILGKNYIILSLLLLLFIFIAELFRNQKNPVINISIILLGNVYLTLPFSMLNRMFSLQNSFGSGFPWLLTGLFIIIWVNDTFSYITGSMIGKNKMFKRISPNKTWEGTAGGFFFSLLAGFLLSRISQSIGSWQWIAFSGLIALSGNFGDLSESMLKRSFSIKDSGDILPGHGGLLDRFDSLLFAVPVAIVFLTLIN